MSGKRALRGVIVGETQAAELASLGIAPPGPVVSDAVADLADYYIVLRHPPGAPLYFPDNLTGACCACGHRIQYRPNGPTKVRRICTVCFGIPIPDERT